MARIKCKYCGKRVSDREKKCSRCNKKINDNNVYVLEKVKSFLPIFLFILVQSILIVLLVVFSKEIFYSGTMSELLHLLLISIVIIVNGVFMGIKIVSSKKYKNILNIFLGVIVILSFGVACFYLVRVISAIRYDNSLEIVKLSEKYSIDDARKIKKSIDDVFEYDYDNVSSRDIVIGNFYEEENDLYILYIDDLYENYRLKFYLQMDKNIITDIYWKYDEDTNLYLVRDGKKTKNFEYYYAMNILNNMRDIEISGLATIDEDVEKVVLEKIGISANAIFSYDELVYQESDDIFYLNCEVHNMDYYGESRDYEFSVKFSRTLDKNKKKVWYYGDSSFDYVNWDVNM